MYILNSKYGQNSNRIWMIARGISMALENNEDIRITSFEDLKDMYRCELPPGRDISVIMKKSLFWAVDYKISRIFMKATGIQKIDGFIGRKKLITLFCDGTDEYVKKYLNDIKYFLEPKEEYISDYIEYIAELKKRYGKLIGVHMRRKDYRTWLDGKYYFEDNIYAQNMTEIGELYKNEKVVFLIFSDEEVDRQAFSDFNAEYPGGTALGDQWMLSQCDHIICTRSTFATWASFVGGNIPMRTILSEKDTSDTDGWGKYS